MKSATTLLAASLALGLAACGGNNNDETGDETVGAGMTAGDTAAATTPMDTGADASTMAAATSATAGQRGAQGDHKALAAVQEVDRHEIAAAEDALAKNVEGDVRAYAETLRDEHTRNLDATQRLLGSSGAGTGMAGHDAMTGTGTGTGMGTSGTTGAAAGSTTGPAGAGITGTTATDAMAGGPGMAEDADLRVMREKHEAERQRLSQLQGEEYVTAWLAAMVKGHEEALAKLDNELIPNATDAGVTRHLQTTRTAIASHLETARSLQSAKR
ncbi:DUF4142 domain-containing protein [Luteimonas yindakuii]|uniref:DUF4142 domain-containing protein n=1 Tax=Luteimonas yindakuii TaxID=2565782 RepID=A0A4Z1R7P1_9GAMM|nr:DUF4142 domain-containing protein [Luteimonas yindakuii]TKS54966.1 DUF4142 domain-containing protein [Luteimonas yindakuii]